MTRRWSAALTALGVLLGTVVGVAPVAAGAPDPCAGSEAAAFACRAYESFAQRPATPTEVETWLPQLPARRTALIAGLARGTEAREATIVAYYARFAGQVPTGGDLDYWGGQVLLPNGLRRLEAALLANGEDTDAELVGTAFALLLGRAPSTSDQAYWQARIGQIGRNRVSAEIASTIEARRARVRWAYRNELLVSVDAASRDHWTERLRTGTSYLDLRIALRSSPDGYRASGDECVSPAPQTGVTCP